jgi:hypothetical protein
VGNKTAVVRLGECQVPADGMGLAIAVEEAMPLTAALTGDAAR